MDRWDIFIIVAAGYIAVMALVRMMAGRRNQLVDHVRQQIQQQQQAKKQAAEEKEEANRNVA